MKVVCIDDEPLILEHLSSKLQQVEDVEVVSTHVCPMEGQNYILKNDVDTVFLDINLPEVNGVDLAHQIVQKKPDIMVVFLTAHEEYAVKAYALEAVDYIVKPIQLERLQIAVNRARKKSQALKLWSTNKGKKLYIKVANHLAFSTDGQHFSPLQWRTAKAEELFLLLLHHRGALVDKYTIKSTVWEDFDVNDSLLHTTISYIRKSLKKFKDYITIQLRGQAYFLELKNVQVDLFHWEASLSNLGTLSYRTIEKYEKVMKQNEDVYLKQYSYIWLEAERERLELLFEDTMKKMASIHVLENELNKAFLTYQTISERQPENEAVHFLLMKLYARNGYLRQVNSQYQKLCNIFQNKLDMEPSEHIQQWYDNFVFVMQNEP